MSQKQKTIELFTVLIVEVCVLALLFYFYRAYGLPIGLVGSLFGFLFLLFLTVKKYSSMTRLLKVGIIGLTFSFLILSILFCVKHYVTDIKISQICVGESSYWCLSQSRNI